MKFLLFGTGDYYGRYKKWFSPDDILVLLDNSPVKQDTYIDGIRVMSPEEGIKLSYDAIVILSFYVKEMKAQLIRLGVAENKIHHFYSLHRLIYRAEIKKPITYYGGGEKVVNVGGIFCPDKILPGGIGKKVLLLSQDLTLGGPAIALYHGAKILSHHGYQVVYGSMTDGPLRKKLLSERISVIIDPNLQIETMENTGWADSFSLIICNTINFHIFLSKRDPWVPVIWWLHDSAFFYDGVDGCVLRNINRTNLWIVAVGPVPKHAFCAMVPDSRVDRLLYGVEDQGGCGAYKKQKDKGGKTRFVTIGYIEWRKGQDILFDAIKMLPKELRQKAEFCLVGQDTSVMAGRLKQDMESMPEITMTGVVDRDEINRIFEEADVLVCPSREDPMPTVAAEAMAYGIPCLVSDAAGTAEYIRDGQDGFVFHSEDTEGLAMKLQWCVEHREELGEIGGRSRQIFDRYFSIDVFEKNLLRLVRGIIS